MSEAERLRERAARLFAMALRAREGGDVDYADLSSPEPIPMSKGLKCWKMLPGLDPTLANTPQLRNTSHSSSNRSVWPRLIAKAHNFDGSRMPR